MKKIKLAIVDDHASYRSGIRSLLEEIGHFEIVFEAVNGNDLLDKLNTTLPEVILMDIEMPEMNGLVATAIVRSKFPSIKVLTLSLHNNNQYIIHVMEKGANGYLLKDFDMDTIIDAIYSVVDKGYYFHEKTSSAILMRLAEHHNVKAQFKEPNLSNQEIKLVELLCLELSIPEIGERMGLEAETVVQMKQVLLEKIGARNSAGITLFAIQKGYFHP